MISECNFEEADELETYYIKEYNTLSPYGYNLESGGNKNKILSEETKKKMSISRMGHPSYINEEAKVKISGGLIKYYSENPKNKQLDHHEKQLPKYISPVRNNQEIIGYTINNNLTGFRKKITSRKLTLDQKLEQAIKISKGECHDIGSEIAKLSVENEGLSKPDSA